MARRAQLVGGGDAGDSAANDDDIHDDTICRQTARR
jgi:hypothetical protein